MQLCLTITKTVGYYHSAGYLCLDLKPENIFVMQSSPDDTVTQLVEFIDFDSVRDITGNGADTVFSYTREWAAPEQLNPYAAGRLGFAADIYTVGEMVYYLLFGKHSTAAEHRGFSKYPFDECWREYRKYTDRPDIQSLFTRLFRGTLRSSASNRFGSIDEVAELFEVHPSTVSAYASGHGHRTPLTEEEKDGINKDYQNGMTIPEIMDKYNVGYSTAAGYGRGWKRYQKRSHKEVKPDTEQQTLFSELPDGIISIVGERMEELERDIKELKDKLFQLEKEHSSLEKWLNKNGVDTSIV
jgi:serine/threonine protein kinase